jgi:formylmethanofuran dehydrogenase subunit E
MWIAFRGLREEIFYGKHVFSFISQDSGRAVRVRVCQADIT